MLTGSCIAYRALPSGFHLMARSLLPDGIAVIPLLSLPEMCKSHMRSCFALLSTSSLANTPGNTRYACVLSTKTLLCMQSIAIREASDGQIIVAGAKDEPAESYQEAIRLLEIGSLSRSTGSTLMNEQSSRSHAIFTLVLEQQPVQGLQGDCLTAKFHLVDLAGSERAKKTGLFLP